MRRFENRAITAVAIAIGFSVIVYNALGAFAPEVMAVPEQSNLESRYYQGFPSASAQALFDGSFQDEFEKYVSDHVPQRDSAMLFNAALQRMSISASAMAHGFDTYPTFFESRYYVVPNNNLIVDRAEEVPSGEALRALDAWIGTLNEAAQQHANIRFVYDCVARHDQTEANPTYRYYDDRLNPAWVQANLIDRLDKRIDAFIDPVQSYDEIVTEWFNADPHWTLERALKSYGKVASRLGLAMYAYDDPVEVIDSWYGGYAKNGLDLDVSSTLEDLPIDFSHLSFCALQEQGGGEKNMGLRDEFIREGTPVYDEGASMYYEYFGGGSAEASNAGPNNGCTALFIGDSLSYCLSRYIAANYQKTVFLLPGNDRFDTALEDYIELYDPDDVIIMMHASKFEMIHEYSPKFIGLDSAG